MSIGFKVHYEVERPDRSLVEAFKGIPVANIADNMNRMSCLDAALVPFNQSLLAATAITVKAPDADNLMFHKALDLAKPGDVIVVKSIGDPSRSLCGEIMMRYAKAKGIAGFVIDGLIRDVDGARAMEDFAIYAKGVTPLGPYKNGPGEVNVPIACGGQVVCPGDIIVGDADGLIVIKPQEAVEVLELAKRHMQNESKTMEMIANTGTMGHGWVDELLKQKNCEM